MADRRFFLLSLLLGLAGQALPASAKDGDGDGGDDSGGDRDNDRDDNDRDDDDRDDDDRDDDDDDKIRAAVERGEAMPLRKILSRLRQSYKGQVVRIRLTGTGRNMLYRIRLIDSNNRLLEVRVNAKTGRVVRTVGF